MILLQSNQNQAMVYEGDKAEICPTLPASMGMGGGYVPMITEKTDYCIGNGQVSSIMMSQKTRALDCMHDAQIVITQDKKSYQDTTGPLMASGYSKLGTQEATNDMYVVSKYWDGGDTAGTLTANNAGGNQRMPDKDNFNAVIDAGTEPKENDAQNCSYVVRRLTPRECERLQGYPDDYTLIGEPEEVEVKDYDYVYEDGEDEPKKVCVGSHKEIAYFYIDDDGKKKRCTDSARYRALGNSIALPWWKWLMRRISSQYEQPATIGSLFDGIGGFCFSAKLAGIEPLWASEIEPFPMSVTKAHFGDEDTGRKGDIEKYL